VSIRRCYDRFGASAEIFDYIELFYNRIRAHATSRYLSPEDYENRPLLPKSTCPENQG
jgi:transposase InsO family protein